MLLDLKQNRIACYSLQYLKLSHTAPLLRLCLGVALWHLDTRQQFSEKKILRHWPSPLCAHKATNALLYFLRTTNLFKKLWYEKLYSGNCCRGSDPSKYGKKFYVYVQLLCRLQRMPERPGSSLTMCIGFAGS